jgi:putative DNA primase/helicase
MFNKTKTNTKMKDSNKTQIGSSVLPLYSAKQALDDKSPTLKDIVAPGILIPGGLIVLGGSPKVGKSDLLLSWLMHMAAGIDFLGMKVSRPLKVAYLADIRYPYLRECVHRINKASNLNTSGENLCLIPDMKTLDEACVSALSRSILRHFNGSAVDVIAIDPLRTVFDGTVDDLKGVREFVHKRLNVLRDNVNPEAGMILAHTTKHCSGEDSFECFGAIRNFSDGCINMSELSNNKTRTKA